jgi:pentatricopeptide repeat protein
VVPDVAAFNAYIRAATLAGRRREAINCLDRMRFAGLAPDVESYCHAMLAASYTDRPQLALSLHDDMIQQGLPACEVSAYTCLLVAGHARDPVVLQDALGVLEAPGMACQLSPRVFAAVTYAAQQTGNLGVAVEWLERMRRAAFQESSPASESAGNDRIAPYRAVINAAAAAVLESVSEGSAEASEAEAVCESTWQGLLEDGVLPTVDVIATVIRTRALTGRRAAAMSLLQVREDSGCDGLRGAQSLGADVEFLAPSAFLNGLLTTRVPMQDCEKGDLVKADASLYMPLIRTAGFSGSCGAAALDEADALLAEMKTRKVPRTPAVYDGTGMVSFYEGPP